MTCDLQDPPGSEVDGQPSPTRPRTPHGLKHDHGPTTTRPKSTAHCSRTSYRRRTGDSTLISDKAAAGRTWLYTRTRLSIARPASTSESKSRASRTTSTYSYGRRYGPWLLTGYKPTRFATLEANKKYYDGPPKVDRTDHAKTSRATTPPSPLWRVGRSLGVEHPRRKVQDVADDKNVRAIAGRQPGTGVEIQSRRPGRAPANRWAPATDPRDASAARNGYDLDSETMVKKAPKRSGTHAK